MSKLPTAKEYLEEVSPALNEKLCNNLLRSLTTEIMQEYANLHTQALREENEKLKRENDELHSKFNKWHDYDI